MNVLKQLIRSAIESFPIDPERKCAILQKLLYGRNRGARE